MQEPFLFGSKPPPPVNGGGDSTHVAMYVRLARAFRGRIETGEWKPGTLLPTLPELSREFGVARVTVRQAIGLLADRGLVIARRGKGTVVVRDASVDPALRRAINDPWLSESVRIEMLSPVRVAALPLDLASAPDGAWRLFHKRHRSEGVPFVTMTLFLRDDIARSLPRGATRRFKLAQLLHAHSPAASLREEVTTTHAGRVEADALECPLGEPLIRMRRWYSQADERLAMAGTYLYRADRFVLEIRRDLRQPDVSAGVSER